MSVRIRAIRRRTCHPAHSDKACRRARLAEGGHGNSAAGKSIPSRNTAPLTEKGCQQQAACPLQATSHLSGPEPAPKPGAGSHGTGAGNAGEKANEVLGVLREEARRASEPGRGGGAPGFSARNSDCIAADMLRGRPGIRSGTRRITPVPSNTAGMHARGPETAHRIVRERNKPQPSAQALRVVVRSIDKQEAHRHGFISGDNARDRIGEQHAYRSLPRPVYLHPADQGAGIR